MPAPLGPPLPHRPKFSSPLRARRQACSSSIRIRRFRVVRHMAPHTWSPWWCCQWCGSRLRSFDSGLGAALPDLSRAVSPVRARWPMHAPRARDGILPFSRSRRVSSRSTCTTPFVRWGRPLRVCFGLIFVIRFALASNTRNTRELSDTGHTAFMRSDCRVCRCRVSVVHRRQITVR